MSQATSATSNVTPGDWGSELGRLQFMIRAAMSGLRTAMPVQVIAVSNSGGVAAIGTVDVQPLVSAVDGSGQVWPHGVIHNVPYMRVQGGANAVIIDPQIGDIGIATVCDRDISGVKAAGGLSAPGSTRKFDFSDMVYLMSIIGSAPAQYIEFNAGGITITSPNAVTVNAATCTVNAPTTVNGTLHVTGAITADSTVAAGGSITSASTIGAAGDVTGNGGTHSLSGHPHVVSNVQSGTGTINTGNTVS